jgi:hypothetical protein
VNTATTLNSTPARDPAVHVARAVLLVAALALALVSIPALVVGWSWENQRHFLKNYHTPDWSEAHIQNQMDYASQSHEANDVIFIGDSTTTVGIAPVLFERRTGFRAYNLGLPGIAGIDSSLRVLELYLGSHPAPQLLVYSPHPKDFGLDAPNWADIRPRIAWSFGTWSGAPPFVSDFTPTYYVREGIRIAAGAMRGGEDHYFGNHVRDWKALVFAQRGYFVSPGVLPGAAMSRPATIKKFVVSPWYAKHLHALARLTRDRGIKLMIEPSPVLLRDHQEDAGELFTWLHDFRKTYPHLQIASTALRPYDASRFGEEMHMNLAGANAFTTHLADQVKLLYPDLKSFAATGVSP